MDVITLPRVLPGTVDLELLNLRLRRREAQVDWSAVEEAPAEALATLLRGLDLAEDDEVLGLATVPDALQAAILDVVTARPTVSGRAGGRRREAAAKPRTLPLTWRREPEEAAGAPAVQEEAAVGVEQAVRVGTVGGHTDEGTPILNAPSPARLRDELERMVLADLLGPAGGPEEEVAERSVSDRYLVGMLAPQRRRIPPEEQDELAVAGEDAAEEGPADAGAAQVGTFFPSSLGLTCCVASDAAALRISATWGRYTRTMSATVTEAKSGNPSRVWKREPMGGTIEQVPLRAGPLGPWSPDAKQPEVSITGTIRRLGTVWIVTLFLVNRQSEPERSRDRAWVFQPELKVESADGTPVFRGYGGEQGLAGRDAVGDAEERAMAMLYRRRVEFAVGHGISVHAEVAPGQPERAVRLITRAVPAYEVAQTASPTAAELPELAETVLDMQMLASTPDANFSAALSPLTAAYGAWIDRQTERIGDPAQHLREYRDVAEQAMADCRTTLARMREGIALLGRDRHAAEAFRFMNRAMWQQRIHTMSTESARRGGERDVAVYDIPEQPHVATVPARLHPAQPARAHRSASPRPRRRGHAR